jgi:hypothetical protein
VVTGRVHQPLGQRFGVYLERDLPRSGNAWHGKIVKLATGHFLGHVEHELAVFLISLAQHAAKLI